MSVDVIFTPQRLAEQLVAHARCESPETIADFCAGDGSLLRAASTRWPNARLIGTDIRPKAPRVRNSVRELVIGKCDFLSERSRRRSEVLNRALKKVDLILLNPPFSYRGSLTISVKLGQTTLNCSPAAAFLLNCIPYLRRNAEIVAILPLGCIRSQKNEAAWHWLSKRFGVSFESLNGRSTFAGYTPTTVIVRIKATRSGCVPPRHQFRPESNNNLGLPVLRLLRGALPMYRYKQSRAETKIPFVHTTELRRNRAALDVRYVKIKSGIIKGELVLLPRVGQPDSTKLVRLSTDGVVFSDCILGVECGTKTRADLVFRLLKQKWSDLARLYQGTGAPYITIRDLGQLLFDSGYAIEAYNNGTSSGLFKKALSGVFSQSRSRFLSISPPLYINERTSRASMENQLREID